MALLRAYISLTEQASLDKLLIVLATAAERHMYLMSALNDFSKSTQVLLPMVGEEKSSNGTQYRKGPGSKL